MKLQVENHIEIDGKDNLMKDLTYEERSRAWEQANVTSLSEIGFRQVKKTQKDKTA